MSIVTSRDIAKELTEIFPGKQITNITIEIPADGCVTATVTHLVEEQQGAELLKILSRFKMVDDVGPFCDVCGKPATNCARDVIEQQPRIGDNIRRYEPGDMHYGCSEHPAKTTRLKAGFNQ